MNSKKKRAFVASILVQQGYADSISTGSNPDSIYYNAKVGYVRAVLKGNAGWQEPNVWQKCNPYADNIEGRRQLDVMYDYVCTLEDVVEVFEEITAEQAKVMSIRPYMIEFVKRMVSKLMEKSDG